MYQISKETTQLLTQMGFSFDSVTTALKWFIDGFPEGETLDPDQVYCVEFRFARQVDFSGRVSGAVGFRGNRSELLRSLGACVEAALITAQGIQAYEDRMEFGFDLYLGNSGDGWILQTFQEVRKWAI